MLITRKPARFTSSPSSLYTFGHPIQRVSSYKCVSSSCHLGALISPLISPGTLTFAPSGLSKLIWFLFRHFYFHLPLMPFSNCINPFLTVPLSGTQLNPLSTPTHLKRFNILVCVCVPTTGRLTTLLSSSLPNSLLCLPLGLNLNSFFIKFSMATCSSSKHTCVVSLARYLTKQVKTIIELT